MSPAPSTPVPVWLRSAAEEAGPDRGGRRSGGGAGAGGCPAALQSGVSYAVGVGLVLIVALVQIVAGISTIYVVGRELSDRTAGSGWKRRGAPRSWRGLGAGSLRALGSGVDARADRWLRGVVSHPRARQSRVLTVGALAFSLASKALGVLFAVWLGELGRALGSDRSPSALLPRSPA